MKKLLIAVPVVCAFFFQSCEKDSETVTETITVTDTVTVNQNRSVAFYLSPLKQDYYDWSSEWALYATMDYSVSNIGDKKIVSLTVNFEGKTEDGSTYSGVDYFSNITVGKTLSSQVLVSVASKKCTSINITDFEIITE